MGENECHVYLDRESNLSYVGDPFVGVPISRDIVEGVANQYGIEPDSLARALREVQNVSVIDIETLYTGFDPLPVGRSDDGLLYILADADRCWDIVATRIGLTETGREALATAHDRQVRNVSKDRGTRSSCGFVVSCTEFPADAVEDIVAVVEKTRLTNRQATLWILSQYVPSSEAVAQILSIPETLVKSDIVAVDLATQQTEAEARTLDVPGPLSRLEPKPQSQTWMGLEWSEWFELRDCKTLRKELPRSPGLYRVRHTELPGLMYVGESGSEGGVRQRVGLGLAPGLKGPDREAGHHHGATRPLSEITELIGGQMEVSVATPPISSNQRHRRAIETTLVAICRREIGWTPMVQLNREPTEHVSESDDMLHRKLKNVSERCSYTVPSWQPWRDVTAQRWLGLDWTENRPLSQRDRIDNSGVHAFRICQAEQSGEKWERSLEEIGTTGSISSRLYKFQNQYEADLLFSVVPLDGLSSNTRSRSRKLEERRYDLVGAHYLATGIPTKEQF